ncbi:hypothetical protein MRX96_022709 [Rhipicephalus microplus]
MNVHNKCGLVAHLFGFTFGLPPDRSPQNSSCASSREKTADVVVSACCSRLVEHARGDKREYRVARESRDSSGDNRDSRVMSLCAVIVSLERVAARP